MNVIRRVARAAVIVALVLVVVVGGAGLAIEHKLAWQVGRLHDAFAGLTDRPEATTEGATNILVIGTGLRSGETAMVAHLDAARATPTVVSLLPATPVDDGPRNLGDVLAEGSVVGVVDAVETLTGVRIDHVVELDWTGVEDLTDSLGEVAVEQAHTVTDPSTGTTWTQGPLELTGPSALAWIDQVKGLEGGDAARTRRQQSLLRSVMDEVLQQEMRKQPWLAYRFVDTVTHHVAIDDQWSVGAVRALAWSVRNLRSANIAWVVAPREDPELWRAVRDDRVAPWLAAHQDALTPWAVE